MRSDMDEVVIERPRAGSRYGYHDHRVRLGSLDHDAMDDLPKNEGYRRPYGYECKQSTDLLGPLYGFLKSKVGCLWNDVYSEICEHINPDSTVQIHILGHVNDHIDQNTWIGEDGRVWSTTGRRYGGGEHHVSDGALYVHPETGILMQMPEKKYSRYRTKAYLAAVAKMSALFGHDWPRLRSFVRKYGGGRYDVIDEAKLHIRVGVEQELHKINGVWYWSVFADVPPPFTEIWFQGDLRHEKLVHRSGEDFLTGQRHYEGRYRSHKRQANRRDLRRYGLYND